MEKLREIDKQIYNCNLCSKMVEKFPNSKTVSIGNHSDIVILGEAPANNGWRKSGIAWYDINHKLLPSGVVLQKLLDLVNLKIEDTYFLEAIKCYPKDKKYLNKCSINCKKFLFMQLDIIKPKVVLALGDSATKTILDIKYKKFSDVVGKEFEVIPIYHPSPISPLSYKGNEEIFKKLNLNKKNPTIRWNCGIFFSWWLFPRILAVQKTFVALFNVNWWYFWWQKYCF